MADPNKKKFFIASKVERIKGRIGISTVEILHTIPLGFLEKKNPASAGFF